MTSPQVQTGGPHSAHEGYGYSVSERTLRKCGVWECRDSLTAESPGWFYLANRWDSASHNPTKTFPCRTSAGSASKGYVREEGAYGNVRPLRSTAAGGATAAELEQLPLTSLQQRFSLIRAADRSNYDGGGAGTKGMATKTTKTTTKKKRTAPSKAMMARAVEEGMAKALQTELAKVESEMPAHRQTVRPLLLRPQVEVAKRHDHMCEEHSTTAKAKPVAGTSPIRYLVARVTAVDPAEVGRPPVAIEVCVSGRRYVLATAAKQRELGMEFN